MSLTSVVSFMPELGSTAANAAFMLIMAVCMNLPCTSLWVVFGKVLAQLFTSSKSRRIINFVMAGLLVAIIPFVFFLGASQISEQTRGLCHPPRLVTIGTVIVRVGNGR